MNYEGPSERRLVALLPLVITTIFALLLVYSVVKLYLPTIRSLP